MKAQNFKLSFGVIFAFCLIQGFLFEQRSLSTSSFDEVDGGLVGGFTKQDIKNCFKAIQKAYNDTIKFFIDHKVYGCKTQVVAGVNYKVWLKKSDSAVSDCSLLIYRDLSNNYSITERSDEDDCVSLLRKNKNQPESSQ